MNRYIRPKHLAFLTAIAYALPLFSADKYWTGAASTSAAAAGNWCDDSALTVVSTAAPQDGDDIHLTSGTAAMTWDLNIYVNSWEQDGYTGTVTFKTGKQNGVATKTATINGYTEDNGETRILKVTGDIVFNTGTWTTTGQPSLTNTTTAWKNGLGVYRLLVDAGGDVTIGSDASITVKGKGYAATQGPGKASSGDSGAHGGCGSCFETWNNATNCYGVVSSPITIGSGGRSTAGGGAVKIVAMGDMVIDGTIAASGANNTSCHNGAGGSIFLTASTLAGAGTLNANGGTGTGNTYDCGGGGGRIAVKLTGAGADFTSFTGTIKAKLGRKTYASAKSDGSGGTIYLEETADGAGCGTLIIDGCEGGFASDKRNYAANTKLTSSIFDITPKKIVFRPEAKAMLDIGGTYDLPVMVQETDSSLTVAGGLEIGPSTTVRLVHGMPDVPLMYRSDGATISVGANGNDPLVIGSGQKLYVDASVQVNGSVRILSGGTLTHIPGYQVKDTPKKMNLSIAGDLTVESGGKITADKCGNATTGGAGNWGGAYGGRARNGNACCYGSIRRPTAYGSMGQGTGNSYAGGAIRITATGNMTVNGTISSNGGDANYRIGSGGSVWLTGASLTGSGSITANSGNQLKDTWYPGGGGRIAVWLTRSGADFSGFNIGNITAYGGKLPNGNCEGGAGTIYLKTGDQADNGGTLIVKNLRAAANYTDIMAGGSKQVANVTDYDVGDVVIQNAKVNLEGVTMTLKRGWRKDSASTFTCAATGGVVANGAEDAYFYGVNTFASFVCEEPGKTLYFGTGTTNSLAIASGGTLTLTGDDTTKLNLRPAVAGEEWKISVPVSDLSSFSVRYVTAECSNATGEEIVATDSTESSEGTCTNWRFLQTEVGQENTWLGATSSSWQESSNWSLERPPLSTDNVIVPATENDPELASATELAGLSVASGAKIRLAGNDLTVNCSLEVLGQMVASGSERIDVPATNVVMAAGSLVPVRSTFALTGDANQTVSLNADFWKLSAEKGGGAISWSGSCTAGRILSLRATAASSVQFASGASLSVEEFTANGDVGGVASLTITGGAISAAKYARAKGVSVTGNNATGGVAVYVDSPYTNGNNNPNWLFGTGRFVWTGEGNDSVFTNGLNWAGGVAPGENDVAEIAAAASITISDPVTVAGLILGGDESSVTFTARAALQVNGELYVGTNAVLSLDVPSAVTGSVLVDDGGKITHTRGGTAETYKLDLTVGGDMMVSESASVDANGKGFSPGYGPGKGGQGATGASYGGRGTNINSNPIPDCYGFYLAPVNYGSSGQSSTYGGGVVKLNVAGVLLVDGVVTADGDGSKTIYNASGGSVYIKCRDFYGRGTVSACGQLGYYYAGDYGYMAGGGRIAIEKTTAGGFANWAGKAIAYGSLNDMGTNSTGNPQGSAGTVAWIVPGSRPRIVIDNRTNNAKGGGSDLPASNGESLRAIKNFDIVLRNSGKLYLKSDVTIWDISLESTSTKISLNGHTLRIRSKAHKDRAGWKGTVTADGGEIIWLTSGLAVTVR